MTATSDLSDAVGATIDALVAATFTPADQIRVLLQLAQSSGSGPAALLCRRLSIIALAEACASYVPPSYDDAQALLVQVEAAMDGEITAAGDAEDGDTFRAMIALRQAVVADLIARGGSLAPLATFTMPENLPALVVAQRIYDDATREDEIVRRVDPVHPLFMPTSMLLLGR